MLSLNSSPKDHKMSRSKTIRSHVFRVRLSEEELAMITELAQIEGLSNADWLRMQIRKIHRGAAEDTSHA